MVKLTKIYTRTGDDGTTGLGTGARVMKTDPRVAAFGSIDEANAAVGLAAVECGRAAPASGAASSTTAAPTPPPLLPRIAGILSRLQHDLFDAGADLCVPITHGEKPGGRLRVHPDQTARLERLIDEFNGPLPTLTSFVLPGGSAPAAALHVARTVTRRAERDVISLRTLDPAATNAEVVKYLNRLSDLLFVLARVANDGGKTDVLWVPGANRSA